MTASFTVGRCFDGVTIAGLLSHPDVVRALVAVAASDPDVRELLAEAADAQRALDEASGPVGRHDGVRESAQIDLAEKDLAVAVDSLAAELSGARVVLPLFDAIRLRSGLHGAKLGNGPADDWAARRRVA